MTDDKEAKRLPQIESHEGTWPDIHESAFVHPAAVVIGRVQIGPNASIWPNVTLRGDEGRIEIGEGTNIQDGSTVHMTGGLSHTIVGQGVTVGHNCILHGCQIGNNALIGMGSIILDNAKIGEGVLVGAGSLVTQNKEFPPFTLVFGNPAVVKRELDEKERAYLSYSWAHYVEQAKKYRERDAS